MERKNKILDGIAYRQGRGLEIGALAWPTVSKAEGEIYFADHVTTEGLRAKYAKDPNVDVGQIVEVDHVWSGYPALRTVVGDDRAFDYVVASHVVEHVPDFVTWISELMSVLSTHGEIRLVVPDRRFTFDYLRGETVVAEIVEAWLQKRRVPSPRAIVDMVLNFVDLDRREAWSETPPGVQRRPLEDHLNALQMAREANENGTYHDVHCWVFTPASFASIMSDLARLGVLRTECTRFHDTAEGEFEFFVGLRAADDLTGAISSWTAMAGKAAPAPWEPSGQRAGKPPEYPDRLDATHLAAAQEALAAMRSSTSWRATAPLRRLKNLLGG